MSIEEYLAALALSLRVGPLARRRILREIEAHLRDAAQLERSRGSSPEVAEARAVEAMGSAGALAERFSHHQTPRRNFLLSGVAILAIAGAATAALALTLGPAPRSATRPIRGFAVEKVSCDPDCSMSPGSSFDVKVTPLFAGPDLRISGGPRGDYCTTSGHTVTFNSVAATDDVNNGAVEITAWCGRSLP